jgi:hypothetical protein
MSYRGVLVSTLLHATVYVFLHNLLNVLVQIANEMGLKKATCFSFPPSPFLGRRGPKSTITEATTCLLYQPKMMMDDDKCGPVSGMLGKGNLSAQRKPASVPLCPPQIPHDLTWARTRAAAVGTPQLST